MAIAEVGSGSQRDTGSAAGTGAADIVYPADVTSGNFGVIAGGIWNTGAGIGSVTTAKNAGTATIGSVTTILGSTGTAWAGGTGKAFISYFPITGNGSLTMRVTTDIGSDYINIAGDEFSGVNATPLDVDGGEATGTSDGATDTITTVTANDLIVGAIVVNTAVVSFNPGTGYTQIGSDNTASIQSYAVEFRIVGGAATYNVDWGSFGGSDSWAMVNAAFKETSVAADPLIGAFMMA